MRSLPYKTAVITGASSGIGLELAKQLAGQGIAVALLARRIDTLVQIAKNIEKLGGKAIAISCDVEDQKSVESAFKEAAARLGPIQLLIANAGISGGTSVDRFDVAKIAQVYNVNLMGMIHSIAAVLPSMLAMNHGHIVGVSSIASYRAFPIKGAYCGSKAAQRVHLEALRNELKPRGVHVTTVCPGFIRTEMTAGVRFKMPFLMDVDRAGQLIIEAIGKKTRVLTFPWQMKYLMGIIRMTPDIVFDWFAQSMQRKSRPQLSLGNKTRTL